MSEVREMKRKGSGNRVSGLWGPLPKIESLESSYFQERAQNGKFLFLRDGDSI